MNELKDTIELMNSSDYKDRFKAEYYQLKIRYTKLHAMLVKLEAGTLDFTPSSSRVILLEQQRYMSEYLRCLEGFPFNFFNSKLVHTNFLIKENQNGI